MKIRPADLSLLASASPAGPQPRVRYEQFAATFAADGTYAQLYFRSNDGAGSPDRLGEPRNGTFSYRKIDAVTAEFSISGGQTGVLKFDSPAADSGAFVDPSRDPRNLSGIVSRSFRLVPTNPGSALVNCSNRAFVRLGSKAYSGFVVTGSAFRSVRIRGIGPSLATFGVQEAMRDPTISISRTAGGSNDDWASQNAESIRRTSAAVGAFPLTGSTKDAALLVHLAPGPYVVEASSADATESGEVLIEVYVLP